MADKKVTALDALTTLSSVDLFLVVDDPAGTPISKKITAENLSTYVRNDIVFPTGVEGLDDLDDVSAASPSAGDVLQYSGSAWLNVPSHDDQLVLAATIFAS